MPILLTARFKKHFGFWFLWVAFMLFVCSDCQHSSAAAQTAEAYLDALVSKDINRVAVLVCPAYEDQALMEFDSLQLVSPSLEDVQCSDSETRDQVTLVKCTGKIVTSYNNEESTIDLAQRVFQVQNEKGDWFICGFE